MLIYKDDKKQYRWRYKSSNGDIIADSGEAYVNKSDCPNGINIMKGSKDTPVDDTTD
jgi:uncharacterized protein YegP (UPF0339 family)